jgi:hypothetical protein
LVAGSRKLHFDVLERTGLGAVTLSELNSDELKEWIIINSLKPEACINNLKFQSLPERKQRSSFQILVG